MGSLLKTNPPEGRKYESVQYLKTRETKKRGEECPSTLNSKSRIAMSHFI